MNTTERLSAIRARCEKLVKQYPACESVAGWRATIAACDMHLDAIEYETNRGIEPPSFISYSREQLLTAWEGIV